MSLSRLDLLHDVVSALRPLVEEAKNEGYHTPFQLWRTLEMEDSPQDYHKTVGHRLPTVQLCLESLNGPGSIGCSWGTSNSTGYNELLTSKGR